MFYNWVEDGNEDYDKLKQHGILIGSFTNPEAAQKMLGKGGTTFSTSDKEFEESNRMVEEEAITIKKRKKRKLLT